MNKIIAAITTAAWIAGIVLVILQQGLTPAILVPLAIGITGLTLVAVSTLRQAQKEQRNQLVVMMITPAIVGSASVPLYATQPVIAFSVLAASFAVVTVVLAFVGSRRTA